MSPAWLVSRQTSRHSIGSNPIHSTVFVGNVRLMHGARVAETNTTSPKLGYFQTPQDTKGAIISSMEGISSFRMDPSYKYAFNATNIETFFNEQYEFILFIGNNIDKCIDKDIMERIICENMFENPLVFGGDTWNTMIDILRNNEGFRSDYMSTVYDYNIVNYCDDIKYIIDPQRKMIQCDSSVTSVLQYVCDTYAFKWLLELRQQPRHSDNNVIIINNSPYFISTTRFINVIGGNSDDRLNEEGLFAKQAAFGVEEFCAFINLDKEDHIYLLFVSDKRVYERDYLIGNICYNLFDDGAWLYLSHLKISKVNKNVQSDIFDACVANAQELRCNDLLKTIKTNQRKIEQVINEKDSVLTLMNV